LSSLASVARGAHNAASLNYPGYQAPRSLDELSDALGAEPDSVLLAGGTDIGLWVTKQLRELPSLVYLGDVPELARIDARANELWIGAAVTLSEAWPALTCRFPALLEQANRFASPPIRNSATLCGNLANGSPIGDSIPAMLALGAELELRRSAEVRRVPLENFYLGYMKNALRRGEFVSGVAIPLPTGGDILASYKVSKRIDQDISAVCATFCIRVAGDRVLSARLAFGGLAGIASRARQAEHALIEHGWNLTGIDASIAALAADFKPLSDLRASSAYRLRAAGNLLRRCFLESEHRPIAIRTHDVLQGAAT
jgi:xanthine dehydrogenase small subunit